MKHQILKVLGIQIDNAGCGNYRVFNPLETLKTLGHEVSYAKQWITGSSLDHIDLRQFTHIICQRAANPTLLGNLKILRDKLDLVFLYEIDDNIHRLDPLNPAYQMFKQGGPLIHHCERFMRESDGIFVSTPDLAGQYGNLNNRIWVLPNYIDFNIREWDREVPRVEALQDRLVIGWAGSIHHREDQEPLQGVLAEVLKSYPEVRFAICSGRPMVEWFIRRLSLPVEQTVFLNPVPFCYYPGILAQFDIGLAPLKDSVFNRAKSDLKLKEYAARGVPYIATDIAPYRRFHNETSGVGGYLCRTPSEWGEALCRLIENTAERKDRGEAIRRLVRKRYSMEANIGKWEAALHESCDRNAVRTWTSSEKPGRNDKCPCNSGRKYKVCCIPAFG